MRVFSLFIDVALLGVVFCVSCIRFFMSLLVFDHHQTWPPAVMSRPLTKDKKGNTLEEVLTAPVEGPRASDRWF